MQRNAIAFVAGLALAACGAKIGNNNPSLCDSPTPPPECTQTCTPGGANTCPAGFHCGPSGTCDQECNSGSPCASNQICTADGTCVLGNGADASTAPDADCPAIHFTPTQVIPSVEVLIDGSGSMGMSDISPTRYKAVANGLVGTSGVITTLQAKVYFGAAIFSQGSNTCPTLDKVGRALNNAAPIKTLINGYTPGGLTPTAPSIDEVVADFQATPPPPNSPPIILLATDGEPNSCTSSTANPGPSITAAKNAYAKGIRLYIVGLAGLNTTFLQNMANAGAGVQTGQPNAPYYTANDPTTLQQAFDTIIGGVLSCDLTITGGMIDTSQAASGIVTLNGKTLVYGTDWILVNGTTIELIGNACSTLKSTANPVVDASFPCNVVIVN